MPAADTSAWPEGSCAPFHQAILMLPTPEFLKIVTEHTTAPGKPSIAMSAL